MDIPSRRARKLARSKWTLFRILWIVVFILGGALLTFVAIQTGNYMGLAALAVLLLFLGVGLNIANIRNIIPGLQAEQQGVRFIAVFSYACMGLIMLALASQLPRSDQASPFEQLLRNRYFEQYAALQQRSPGVSEAPIQNGSVPSDNSVPKEQQDTTISPTVQLESKEDHDAPVIKSETVKTNPVVTKVLNAHILQINDQQIIRLIGIQVPEQLQAAATRYLHKMVLNQEVTLETCTDRPLDEYGRIRAVVTVNNVNINRKLIELGYSPLVITIPCSLNLKAWSDAEETAKQHKLGVWEKHP